VRVYTLKRWKLKGDDPRQAPTRLKFDRKTVRPEEHMRTGLVFPPNWAFIFRMPQSGVLPGVFVNRFQSLNLIRRMRETKRMHPPRKIFPVQPGPLTSRQGGRMLPATHSRSAPRATHSGQHFALSTPAVIITLQGFAARTPTKKKYRRCHNPGHLKN
jgi:hypothetical protein